ncbi:MAG TPA: DUF2278 family protein [Acidimicrobiales bacterium]|nr:DUF2278 family protein [Acidimicrobiales bacterium]
MPIANYGVLAAHPVDRRREDPHSDDSPHYQIHLVDENGVHYRAAVNVLSQEAPSELLYAAIDDFRHPVLDPLPARAVGWMPLPSRPGGASLDFVRGNLFDPAVMRALPPDLPGVDNDLADMLDHHVERAMADPESVVYLWGEPWGPENQPDKIFGFAPGGGVHNIHMNQGNSAEFRGDDGVWQDGGVVVRLPGEYRWVAFFLAFQSQSWHTDDTSGHALPSVPPGPTPTDGAVPVRIVAALVNPVGPAPEAEKVMLLNASPDPVDLGGWHLADRVKRTQPLPDVAVAPGDLLVVDVQPPVQLSNQGGIITLLDGADLKVHGVSYSSDEARREGWTLTF